MKNIYYLDVDLYRYFIGRADQSVNEKVMVTRVDQQLRVTYQMIDSHDLRVLTAEQPKLGRYMFNYLAMMMAISSIFLVIDGRPEALGKKTQLWEYLRTVDSGLYHKMKYRAVSAFTNFPGYQQKAVRPALPPGPEDLQVQLRGPSTPPPPPGSCPGRFCPAFAPVGVTCS